MNHPCTTCGDEGFVDIAEGDDLSERGIKCKACYDKIVKDRKDRDETDKSRAIRRTKKA